MPAADLELAGKPQAARAVQEVEHHVPAKAPELVGGRGVGQHGGCNALPVGHKSGNSSMASRKALRPASGRGADVRAES